MARTIELWLMRHGSAEDANGKSDAERRLTEKGHAESSAQGEKLKSEGVSFDLAATSPLIRAEQTMEDVLEASSTPVGERRRDERLLAMADPAEMLELLEHLARDFPSLRRVLFVGHNPSMGKLKARLLRDPGNEKFKKAAIHAFEVTLGGNGKLESARPLHSIPRPEV